MKNVRHSSEQPKWGTGPETIMLANSSLWPVVCSEPGGMNPIYVDPFSEPEFNLNVKADRILTGAKGDNGYKDRWIDHELAPRADHILSCYPIKPKPAGVRPYTALVNPPGDESGENVKNAWALLVGYYVTGWIDSALWVAFNLNQLQTLQGVAVLHPLSQQFEGCLSVPDHRLGFIPHSSRPKTKFDRHGVEVDVDDAPSHPSFSLLLPSRDEVVAADQRRMFEHVAGKLGAVR